MNMRTLCRPSLLLVATLACAQPQEPVTTPQPIVVAQPPRAVEVLQAEIDTLLADPAFANAHWGVMVQSMETGEILYRHNQRKLFMPASNMKLVTASAALARLGADHRFTTRVDACGAVNTASGVLNGDLLVVGGGDPSISQRFGADDDALAIFREWADSLQARGITQINGNIVGDDDLFDDVHIGPGWAWDYLGAAYAAEIGALLFNEGALAVRFTAAPEVGDTATHELVPSTSYVTLHGNVVTTADSTGVSVYARRRPFVNDIDVGGNIWIGQDKRTRYVAPFDPTMYFMTVLHETLQAEGIGVAGSPGDRDTMSWSCEAATTLFVHASPELGQILQPFMKESQNQIGEMLLRYLGAALTDTGSVATGRRAVAATLTGWGVTEDSYVNYDGSGLSRYNYLAPEAVVRILRAMARHEEFTVFYDALPIAGVDGTLEERMRGSRAENNARAKTGFISNARALSGYVTTRDDELLAFSIIANNFDIPTRPVEWVQDLIVERLANFER